MIETGIDIATTKVARISLKKMNKITEAKNKPVIALLFTVEIERVISLALSLIIVKEAPSGKVDSILFNSS